MADDASMVEQLRAELREFRERDAAAQAEIAVLRQREAALMGELGESREQQSATAEILRVIASSPTDVQRVLDVIIKTAARICEAHGGVIDRIRARDGRLAPCAVTGRAADDLVQAYGVDYFELVPGTELSHRSTSGRAFLEQRTITVDDVAEAVQTEYPANRENQARWGYRSQVTLPLVQRGETIGVLALARFDIRPFTEQQIALLETFADQAVIGMENAQLFEVLEQRNRELSEALEQQTATAEVLRIIATTPTDLRSVLQSIIDTAARLCGAQGATIMQIRESDGRLAPRVSQGRQRSLYESLYSDPFAEFPGLPLAPGSPAGRALLERRSIHVHDMVEAIKSEFPDARPIQPDYGYRTMVMVPLIGNDVPIGVFAMMRYEVQSFTDEQRTLLETFADQAVIAIENARLFEELERRNVELQESNRQVTEALEQQTATADILRVIASSPADLQRVLNIVAESAARLCEAKDALVWQAENDVMWIATTVAKMSAQERGFHLPIDRGTVVGRAIVDRAPVHIEDAAALADEDYPLSGPLSRLHGVRTALALPLMREGAPIGAIHLRRDVVRPFTEQQIALLETFADQAVIAIENARLFSELEQRIRELRALSEIGQALSSSLDLQQVLATIVGNATRLAGADGGVVYEYDEAEGVFEVRAADRMADDVTAALNAARFRLGEGVVGRAGSTREPFQVGDLATTDVLSPDLQGRLLANGMRSVLAIPLLRETRVLGGLIMARQTTGPFPDDVVALLQTFATQSALAIDNAHLYRALEEASRHKSTFLANMSHELRTPLNAIIGYSEMLQEEAEDLDEQTFLPDLQKVNAAGKHLLGLINDILDLSKIEAGRMDLFVETFEVGRLVRDVEAIVQPLVEKNGNTLVVECVGDIGTMQADLTKVRQTLFNLLSNASKFTDHGTITLTALREPDDRIAFAVADTGIGMTEEQLGRLFEAFAQAEASTRSKYGGTGLGLAISRHFCRLMGGDLTVTSTYGQGSTFTFTLPAVVAEAVARPGERGD